MKKSLWFDSHEKGIQKDIVFNLGFINKNKDSTIRYKIYSNLIYIL